MNRLILGECSSCGYKRRIAIPNYTLNNKVYAICYSCKRGRDFHVKLQKIIGTCEHCHKYFDLNNDHFC